MKGFLPRLATLFLKTWHASVRVRHVRVAKIDGTPQYVLSFWHEHLFLMAHARFRRPISALVSQSRDGENLTRVFEHYGIHTSRGSSTRGGAAGLRDLLRRSREGHNLAITPDGPKGPPRIAKDGVVVAAQATGLPIMPVAFAAKKKSCCAPGTAWWSRSLCHGRSSSTGTRSRFLAAATSKSGARTWRRS